MDLLNENRGTKLTDIMTSFQLEQLLTEPTRVADNISGSTKALIDHIYVTNSPKVVSSMVLPLDLSDHFAVFMSYHNKSVKESTNCHRVLELSLIHI